MRNSLSRTRLCAFVAVAGTAASALAGDRSATLGEAYFGPFEERAGALEFSGRMLVAPRTVLDFQREGMTFEAAADRRATAIARLADVVVHHDRGPDRFTVRLPDGMDETQYGALLGNTDDYRFAHPDWIVFPTLEPDDPRYDEQWHHPIMQSEMAWEITTGSSSIVTAYVDTGVLTSHEDLSASLLEGYNSADRLLESAGGVVNDQNGHGTHVAGCGAAIGDNGVGVAGVGWNLGIRPVRATAASAGGGGGTSLTAILHGAEWAVENGARTASCSWTGVEAPAVGDSGTYIKSQGGLLLYAANNFGQDHSGFEWPDTIVVGASNPSDVRAGFSSFGRAVDVFAPGVDILSSTRDGGYGRASGTSMATPVTNGVIGTMWSAAPDLTPDIIQAMLYDTCDDIGPSSIYGNGRVNLFQAVAAAAGSGEPAAPVAVDDESSVIAGGEVAIDVLSNDFDINGDPITIDGFDATGSLGGTIERSVGTGPDGRDELVYSGPAGTFGLDEFTYTITDGGFTAEGTVTVDVLDPSTFRTPENPSLTQPGVDVAYYEVIGASVLPDFDTLLPYATDVADQINFPSTSGEFMNSGRSDNVGAVFRGYVEVAETGVYTLFTNSDDGSKLYLGDDLVVDNDGLHGMVEIGTEVALLAGKHALRVEFFEAGGGAGVIFSLRDTDGVKQVVSAGDLSRDLACPADFDGDGELSIFDFLAFQNAFDAGDPSADFDGDGSLSIFDFLAFQNAFDAGC
ncbi:MAG: S8 family serine peptidase [Planctomycetota bacterium]